MAGALRRRAATAVLSTIRGSSLPAVRSFAAIAKPRLPAAAAATTGSALRLSSAAAAMRNAALPRHCHTAAVPELVEARIQRLEVDFDNKIAALRVEISRDSAEAIGKVRMASVEGLQKLERAQLQAYDSFLQAQSRQDDRLTNLGQLIFAEGRRSVHRANTSSAESARSLQQVGKVSWRVVITVVGAAGSAAFATATLLASEKTANQTRIADDLVRTRTTELKEDFNRNLESTVRNAVEVALAKEHVRRTVAAEDTLHAFAARIEEVLGGLDKRIETAVEAALAKQALGKK